MPSRAETSQSRSLSSLRTLLQRASRSASGATVNRLRTTIRNVETTLKGDNGVQNKKLLNELKHIRKRAKRLRDIDVQLEILKSFGSRNHADVISVRKALLKKRSKQERKLTKAISAQLRESLETLQLLTNGRQRRHPVPVHVNLQELAASLLAESRCQELSPQTLHGFRTACKHIRYRAESASPSESRDEFIRELKRIQDTIGLWHDYILLADFAEKVLGSGQLTSLQRHLRVQAHAKYLDSLRTVKDVERVLESSFRAPARKPTRSEPAMLTRSALAS